MTENKQNFLISYIFYYYSTENQQKQNFYNTFENNKNESGTEIGNSLKFDFVVPPPHSWVGL